MKIQHLEIGKPLRMGFVFGVVWKRVTDMYKQGR